MVKKLVEKKRKDKCFKKCMTNDHHLPDRWRARVFYTGWRDISFNIPMIDSVQL